ERLGADFAAAAAWIASRQPAVRFLAPMASHRVRAAFERLTATLPRSGTIALMDGQGQRELADAAAAIVAPGTATLAPRLSGRPMVVAYRVSAVTGLLLRSLGLVKVPYFSQPNLLVGRRLVPEFVQEEVSGPALGAVLLREIEDPAHMSELAGEFRRVHEVL